MVKKDQKKSVGKEQIKKPSKDTIKLNECKDALCPVHGTKPLKLRGRIFEGHVIKKLHGRVSIQFERSLYIPKYERYEKRRTKLHARLPDCLKDELQVGDLIQIAECRPLSKIIHFVVVKKVKNKKELKEEGELKK